MKNHVRNILEKLHLHSRMEAVVYAVREKLLDLDETVGAGAPGQAASGPRPRRTLGAPWVSRPDPADAARAARSRRSQSLVPDINALEPEIAGALRRRPAGTRRSSSASASTNGDDLDDLLLEAFAVVREAARRVIGQRHFDVQLMGGAALHFGWVAEMKTGEGKTLVSTLPGYLNGLTGKGMHLVTVNDYLAKFQRRVDGPHPPLARPDASA